MGFPRFIHDPDAVLDYPIKFTGFEDDPVIDVTVSADDGATIASVSPVADVPDGPGQVSVARISGAEMLLNHSYNVTFHYETTSGLEDDRSITLVCKER